MSLKDDLKNFGIALGIVGGFVSVVYGLGRAFVETSDYVKYSEDKLEIKEHIGFGGDVVQFIYSAKNGRQLFYWGNKEWNDYSEIIDSDGKQGVDEIIINGKTYKKEKGPKILFDRANKDWKEYWKGCDVEEELKNWKEWKKYGDTINNLMDDY